MPKLIELAKAIAIAELEIDGQYSESKHDALFEQFGANGLDPQDLAPFPDYLVCVNAGKMQPVEHAQLMEILSSSLPIKVLLQIDDILEESTSGEGSLTAGMRARQIANMAIGLNEVYVLQSASSNLFQFRERMLRGLTYRGPALFSVFSGASGKVSDLPPYLMAAAAMESRAFRHSPTTRPPARIGRRAFSFMPIRKWIWIGRYRASPTRTNSTNGCRKISLLRWSIFFASDRRYARHLARVPRAKWNGSMIPVDESLSRERKGLPDKVPSLLMVDSDNVLQKVIVDEKLIREARRCREMWHSLQELGGVHNSHAEKLLARERKPGKSACSRKPRRMRGRAGCGCDGRASCNCNDGGCSKRAGGGGGTATLARRSLHRNAALLDLQRVHHAQSENVRLRRQQAGLHRRHQRRHLRAAGGGRGELPGVHHPPGKPRNPKEPGLEELLKRAEPFM